LVRVAVEQVSNCLLRNVVVHEEPLEHLNQILSFRFPHEFLHPSIAKERRVQSAQVVRGDYDWHTVHNVLLTPILTDAAPFGVVAQVHQCPHHHLRVDGALRVSEPAHASVEIVDDERAHLALVFDHLRCSAVALADELPRRARPLILELTG